MKKLTSNAILLVVLCSLFGCASVPPINTNTIEDYKLINKPVKLVSAVSGIPLRSRYYSQNTGAAMSQFGIAGVPISVAIDATRNLTEFESPHKTTYPFKNISSDIDFNNLLLHEFTNELESISWLTPTLTNSLEESVSSQQKIQQNDPALLLSLTSDYSFSPDLSEMYIRVAFGLYDIDKSKASKTNVFVYKGVLSYQSAKLAEPTKTQKMIDNKISLVNEEYENALKNNPGSRTKRKLKESKKARIKFAKQAYSTKEKRSIRKKMWLKGNGHLIKKKIDYGIQQIGSLFAYDINNPLDSRKYNRGNFLFVMRDSPRKVYRITGKYLSYTPGELVSVSRNEKLRKRQGR